MRKVWGVLLGIGVVCGPLLALAAPVQIELRPIESQPGPGRSAVNWPGVAPPTYLGATVAVTNDDIVYTQAMTYAGQPAVGITLNKSAATRFCTLTGNYISQPLGVLVDGKLVNVAPIPHPICGGTFTITGHFSAAEAQRIAHTFPDGPSDALKAFSVWRGTGEEPSMPPYPMILFVNHRCGEDFEGTIWYPLLGNGLIKVTGRIDAQDVMTLSEDEVIAGKATEQQVGVVAGATYTATLENRMLKGHGKWTDPKTKELITLRFSLKLAEP